MKARPGACRTCFVLILLVLLLIQAQFSQAAADVVWAVIPSWDDPDTDDGNTPVNGGSDQAAGLPTPTRPWPSGSLTPSDVVVSDHRSSFSDPIARAPPATSAAGCIASMCSPSSSRAPDRS